jgi:hypothetical protein
MFTSDGGGDGQSDAYGGDGQSDAYGGECCCDACDAWWWSSCDGSICAPYAFDRVL